MMKIWASADKELRFTEIDANYIAINVFTEEFIIGVMCDRREIEHLCISLAEWCGFPLFRGDEEE